MPINTEIINIYEQEYICLTDGDSRLRIWYLDKQDCKDILYPILRFLGYSDKQISVLKMCNDLNFIGDTE